MLTVAEVYGHTEDKVAESAPIESDVVVVTVTVVPVKLTSWSPLEYGHTSTKVADTSPALGAAVKVRFSDPIVIV